MGQDRRKLTAAPVMTIRQIIKVRTPMTEASLNQKKVAFNMNVNRGGQVNSDERALGRRPYPGQFVLINCWTLT